MKDCVLDSLKQFANVFLLLFAVLYVCVCVFFICVYECRSRIEKFISSDPLLWERVFFQLPCPSGIFLDKKGWSVYEAELKRISYVLFVKFEDVQTLFNEFARNERLCYLFVAVF